MKTHARTIFLIILLCTIGFCLVACTDKYPKNGGLKDGSPIVEDTNPEGIYSQRVSENDWERISSLFSGKSSLADIYIDDFEHYSAATLRTVAQADGQEIMYVLSKCNNDTAYTFLRMNGATVENYTEIERDEGYESTYYIYEKGYSGSWTRRKLAQEQEITKMENEYLKMVDFSFANFSYSDELHAYVGSFTITVQGVEIPMTLQIKVVNNKPCYFKMYGEVGSSNLLIESLVYDVNTTQISLPQVHRHTYGDQRPEMSWSPDGTASMTFVCSQCGERETVFTQGKQKATTELTCVDDESVTYSASIRFNKTTYEETKTFVLQEAHGHDYDEDGICTVCGEEIDLELTYDSTLCGYVVTGYKGAPKKIILLNAYYGKPLVAIGEEAFDGCASLVEIRIPSSVRRIGASAFSDCTSLTSITIPDSVTSIGSGAFSGCSSLVSMTIPFVGGARKTSSDTYQYPFGYIFGTSSYTGGTATKQYYHGSSTSSTTNTTFYIPASLRSVTVTGGNILYGAFYNCSMLTSITIPDSVTSIGWDAFSGCTSLTSVTIGSGVTSIGEDAFRDCTSLTSVTIPEGVTRIEIFAFYKCTSLTSVYYTGDIASWCGITFGDKTANPLYYANNLYINNELVTDLVIPDGVTEIKEDAFHGATCLTSVTIPDSVTSIENYAFYGCTSLTSVTIGNGVTSIGQDAFEGCYKLVEVYNKSSLNITKGSTSNGYIGYYAKNIYTKKGGSKLSTDENGYILYTDGEEISLIGYTGTDTVLTLPIGITEIYEYAFYKNKNITSVTIPDSVTSIASITIPDGSWKGGGAFSDCTSLTSVTIGNSVTSIENYAFRGCTSLESVYYTGDIASWCGITFGDSDANPLYYAHNLYINNEIISGEIVLPNTVTTIPNYTFKNSSITSITIPDSVTSIGSGAFKDCTSLTSVTIGSGVTSIGDYAFYNCPKLTRVYYTGDIASWCGISFGSNNANPLIYVFDLYINNEIISGEIVLPNTVTTIPNDTFKHSSITSITIPDSVTSIGGYAFYNCTALMSVTFDEDSQLTSIEWGAFSGCTSLTSVTIPDSVTSIGSSAFSGCTSLASITIPDSVTSIEGGAFYNCTSLTSITIPDSVTSIGNSAFYGCSKLTEIVYEGTRTQWYDISRGTDWNSNTGEYVVHCSNGDISKG